MRGKVSIIVPIYNCEDYLKECLESLQNQTYIDFEVLLINDGSTDNSENIINEYVKNDERFKVYKKKNGGTSSARNYGIKRSKGEYLFFVDSDDYIELDALDNLSFVIKKYNSDVVMGKRQWNINNKEVPDKSLTELFEKNIYNKNVLDKKEIWKIIAIHGKLFKRNFIINNSLFFEEGMSSEDFIFTYRVNSLTQKISIIENLTYTYRRRIGGNKSITQKRLLEHNLKSRFKQIEMTNEIASSEIGKKMIKRDELKLNFNVRLIRHIDAFTEEISYNKKRIALKLIKDYCSQKGFREILTKVSRENQIKYYLIKNEELNELINYLKFLEKEKRALVKLNQEKLYLYDKRIFFNKIVRKLKINLKYLNCIIKSNKLFYINMKLEVL